MKLTYYLRGLRIGIVITAVTLSFGTKHNMPEMTDEQIKARAAELGMVEESLLSDVMDENAEAMSEEQSTELTTEENTEAEDKTEEVVPEENITQEATTEENTETEDRTEEAVSEEQSTMEVQETETVEIVVNAGESSVSISKRLATAGLVDSAAAYDSYLCKNGYDKKICTGSHMIKKGATEEEIAKAITSK